MMLIHKKVEQELWLIQAHGKTLPREFYHLSKSEHSCQGWEFSSTRKSNV